MNHYASYHNWLFFFQKRNRKKRCFPYRHLWNVNHRDPLNTCIHDTLSKICEVSKTVISLKNFGKSWKNCVKNIAFYHNWLARIHKFKFDIHLVLNFWENRGNWNSVVFQYHFLSNVNPINQNNICIHYAFSKISERFQKLCISLRNVE